MVLQMRENSYVVIQSFMLTELGLKGNELIVYAVIYGYTQDGDHWYYGTRGHLAEWCGASKGTVTNCLNSLVEKGYIERREVQRPGRVEVQYQAKNCHPLSKIGRGGAKNYEGGLSKIGTINIKKDNKENKKGGELGKGEYPAAITCKCGYPMERTNMRKTGTDVPYYRCQSCGDERLWGE